MRKIQPIPRALLIHSIEYKEKTGNDGWDSTYADPIIVKQVRMEFNKSYVRGTNSEGEQYSAKLYVDRKYSKPYPDFVAGSKIVFGNDEYEIADTNPIYDFNPNSPHHYEIGLR